MLDYEELGGIFGWGMIDHFSWLQGFACYRPKTAPRRDRRELEAA